MAASLKHLPICLLSVLIMSSGDAARSRYEDDIDLGMRGGGMLKMLREMANQTNATAAESLNLPANASSIRENITDTFSCKNRTYGYYADVDNECQIFHVCQPSQTASGRNFTYKWSFICPNETIFNQEVLVCTRPEDAIDCADSPMYYDRNDEIGKVNTTMSDSNTTSTTATRNKPNNNINMKRKENIRKQNLVMAGGMMNDDREEMMADEMMMSDGEKENNDMMVDNDMMKTKEARRKQSITMVGGEKKMMANGMVSENNIAVGSNKEDVPKKPITEIMVNGHKDKAHMINSDKTDDMKQQHGHRKPLPEEVKNQDTHKKQIMDAMKKEQENMKKLMTEKDVTNVELTDMNKEEEPVVEKLSSDFGTYSQGDNEDPIDEANERMALERSFKRNGKRIKRRGLFRFKADV